jgi:hypothetical protein
MFFFFLSKNKEDGDPLGNLWASVEIQALHGRVDFQASDILQIFERKDQVPHNGCSEGKGGVVKDSWTGKAEEELSRRDLFSISLVCVCVCVSTLLLLCT